jgi:putative DNA primase/helicase
MEKTDKAVNGVSIPDNHSFNIIEKTAEAIFTELLGYVKKVNFLELVHGSKCTDLKTKISNLKKEGADEGTIKEALAELNKLKISRKQYIVITIEQIAELAARYDWSLCQRNDAIYLYNGIFWGQIDSDLLKWFLGIAAEKMGVDCWDARHFQFKEELFRQFLSASRLKTLEPAPGTVLINLQNGTLEFNNGTYKIRERRKEDFLTYCLPYEFNPKATFQRFQNFLNEVLPDKDSQNILAEFLGYIFTTLKLEKVLWLYGTGGNGKGVVYELINMLLGRQNVSNYSLQSLTDKSGYQRAEISDKLLNYSADINTSLEIAAFKLLASGEPIEARRIYGRPFIIHNYCKFAFNANAMPAAPEHTNAFFRRFLIVPFTLTVPTEKQNPDLHNQLFNAEASGIFNWILEGLQRILIQKKFSACKASENALNEYRTESDSVQMFLNEACIVKDNGHYEALKDIYSQYKIYCLEDGYLKLGVRNFAKRLESLGFAKERLSNGNVIYCIIDHTKGAF